jgi:hypothetical protein
METTCELTPRGRSFRRPRPVSFGQRSAIENGVHYRRGVSFQEDQCRVKDRGGAEILAVMRNLAVGLYELELERGRTEAESLSNWLKSQTFSNAHRMRRR